MPHVGTMMEAIQLVSFWTVAVDGSDGQLHVLAVLPSGIVRPVLVEQKTG